MCGHGVIGNRTAVLTEMQIRFADLEENLNAPASPIQADDFFFAKGHVGRNQYQIVFTPIAVMHIDKADRNCLAVLNGFRFYGKQVFSTATAFRILLVFFAIAMTSKPISFMAVNEAGAQNHVSNRTC